MKSRLDELNPSLFGMIVVELLFMVIAELIILLVIPDTGLKLRCMVGMLFGVLYAIFASIHLSYCIFKVVYGKGNPRSTLIIGYGIRVLVMFVVFAGLFFTNIGNVIAVLIGMFSMKVAAYAEPITNKLIPEKRSEIEETEDVTTSAEIEIEA